MSPQDAQNASEREAKSDKHESDDLAAQQEAASAASVAATAAQGQVAPTWAQVGFAFAGTLLLIVTVVYTVRTYEHSVSSSERQLRAYVLIDHVDLADIRDRPEFTVHAKNSGQTPALGLRFSISITSPEPTEEASINEQLPFATRDIGAGAEQPMTIRWEAFDGRHKDDVLTGRVNAWLYGIIRYVDVFGIERFTWYKNLVSGEAHPDVEGQFVLTISPTGDGNHST